MLKKNTQYVSIPDAFILKRIAQSKSKALYKKGTFISEIIWGHTSYIISNQPKRKKVAFRKGMFLFGMVRGDANKFLKENNVKLPKKKNTIEYNNQLDLRLLDDVVGTDLNHAYWRIAYNLGVISKKTYLLGLDDKFKEVRLAALSTMGAEKKYQVIEKGVITDKVYLTKGNKDLKNVYTLIRFTCYKYMADLKKLLGKDFVCYKTDAIYYVNSRENKKLVRDFFKSKNLLMKDLQ